MCPLHCGSLVSIVVDCAALNRHTKGEWSLPVRAASRTRLLSPAYGMDGKSAQPIPKATATAVIQRKKNSDHLATQLRGFRAPGVCMGGLPRDHTGVNVVAIITCSPGAWGSERQKGALQRGWTQHALVSCVCGT